MDWDDAYANMAHIPGSEALPDAWTATAAAYRESGIAGEWDLSYGTHPRERFDLIRPDTPSKGLMVFVHGGYWMRLDKSFWTHLAEGARASGWAVALPSYTLAPEFRIGQITSQIGRAISTAAKHIGGPIRLVGHSAGGHLVARMACDDSPLTFDAAGRVQQVVSISGVHDLRPLMQTEMNATLRLDGVEATVESPALRRPVAGTRMTAWVGGDERPEFLRQSQLLSNIWYGLGAVTRLNIEAGKHHFSVLDGLSDPSSDLMQACLE